MKDDYTSLSLKIKNTLRNKTFYFFFVVILLCCIIVFSSLSFLSSFNQYINDNYSKNIGFKTLSIHGDNAITENIISDIKKISYVDDVISSKYFSVVVDTSFHDNNHNGILNLIAIPDNSNIKIKYGKNVEGETYKALCPNVFFPDSDAASLNFKLNKNKVINGKTLLDKNFEIYYNSYEDNEDNFRPIIKESFSNIIKVSGIYDSTITMNNSNDCYLSKDTIREIVDKSVCNDDNAMYSYFVFVDNVNHVDSVYSSLVDKGYYVEILNTFDNDLLENIKIICYLIALISIIVAILVLILYFRKKLENDSLDIGIYRFLGLNKSLTRKYIFIENLFILLISFSISLILFFIIKTIILCKYYEIFKIYNINFALNYSSVISTFLIIVIIPTIISYILNTRIINKNIINLLEKEEHK